MSASTETMAIGKNYLGFFRKRNNKFLFKNYHQKLPWTSKQYGIWNLYLWDPCGVFVNTISSHVLVVCSNNRYLGWKSMFSEDFMSNPTIKGIWSNIRIFYWLFSLIALNFDIGKRADGVLLNKLENCILLCYT